MQNVREASKPRVKSQTSEGTWIQITFTLDPGQYQKLWELAEEEHRTIPDLVHESVVSFLGNMKSASWKRNISVKRNAEDLS